MAYFDNANLERYIGEDEKDAVVDLLIDVNRIGVALPLDYLDWLENLQGAHPERFRLIAHNRTFLREEESPKPSTEDSELPPSGDF
ncbi:hypothetical protein BK816_02705 [Boudabousia tangfeifanii]|uniref:Uncharacterized protein n=1 Tax=Boudabousia tangfeifanii TaxID=1912795 RepID=A0A1D9MJ68_9ACTO|nr:hypothetical protein BK816_02705 [Boudabousia tangfeifanii]